MRARVRALAAGLGACGLLSACGGGAPAPALEPGARRELVHPGALHEIHVSAPALAVAGDGEVYLAWSRRDVEGASLWAVRVGAAQPVRVNPAGYAPAASHDPPGLAVGSDGRVHVLWTARRRDEAAPFASDLLLSTSRDAGASFGPPLVVAGAAVRSRDFSSLAAGVDGALLVAWLENAGPRAHARVARVDAEAGRVSDERVLEESACVCCRTALAAGPEGAAAVLWRGERAGNLRDMYWARSSDGGRHFAAPARVHADGWALDACPHRGGALAFYASGRAVAAWYTEGERGEPSLRLATADPGAEFRAPRELHEGSGALPDRVALALSPSGPGLVVFESATSVRREIVARALGPAAAELGPGVVLSHVLKASGPAAAARPGGGYVLAWNEEAFPALRTVVLEVAPR